MSYMSRGNSDEPGLRVRCPTPACKYELSAPDWEVAPETDHRCPNCRTWFRVEGSDSNNLESFQFYQINPTEINLENMR